MEQFKKDIQKAEENKKRAMKTIKLNSLKYVLMYLILFFTIRLFAFCTYDPPTKKKEMEGCSKIDTLVLQRYQWKDSFYINVNTNKIIRFLESKSKIYSNCEQKGFGGYVYFSDSVFNSDIEKWRVYFNCVK